jgi:hypothetical protein
MLGRVADFIETGVKIELGTEGWLDIESGGRKHLLYT